MHAVGEKALPVLLVDGDIRAHGHSPTRDELVSLLAEQPASAPPRAQALGVTNQRLVINRIVVLDTAPTGHTLLLLDAAQCYQREIERTRPYGWQVNSTLAGTSTGHPPLRARAQADQTHLERIERLSHTRTWTAGWQTEPPTGTDALRTLASHGRSPIAGNDAGR